MILLFTHYIEGQLGDSESISRICREQPSLAKRIWERIKALIDTFSNDVYNKLGITRTVRLFTKELKFSRKAEVRSMLK